MHITRISIFSVFLLLLFSQTNTFDTGSIVEQSEVKNTKTPILGWGNYKLGTALDNITTLLAQDPALTPKMNVESDIEEEENEYFISLIRTRFFVNFYFQFIDKKCYLIRITYSPKYFSYIKLYNKLKDKYGEP
ncbi:hypothetical protein ACFL6D_05460, partial [Spirochaetota bacterium]